MKYLSELKKDAQISEDVLIKGLKINSKEIEKGDAFFCIKGVGADRHDFIEDALDRGAIALIVDHQVDFAVPQMIVEDTNACLDELYANFYDHPEKKLKLLGLTGTDGKTSAATITAELLGEKCAYIGTNGVSFKGRHLLTNNTTPGQDELYKYFAMFCEEGIEYVAMETSSEAFFQRQAQRDELLSIGHFQYYFGTLERAQDLRELCRLQDAASAPDECLCDLKSRR